MRLFAGGITGTIAQRGADYLSVVEAGHRQEIAGIRGDPEYGHETLWPDGLLRPLTGLGAKARGSGLSGLGPGVRERPFWRMREGAGEGRGATVNFEMDAGSSNWRTGRAADIRTPGATAFSNPLGPGSRRFRQGLTAHRLVMVIEDQNGRYGS